MQRDRIGTATSAEVQERLEEEAAFARVAAWHAQRRVALASDDPDADADDEDGGDAPTAPAAPAASAPAGRTAKVRARHTGGRVGRRYQLHRGHFAFMRAYVQGLDLGAMWDRYMAIEGASTDMRSVRRGL